MKKYKSILFGIVAIIFFVLFVITYLGTTLKGDLHNLSILLLILSALISIAGIILGVKQIFNKQKVEGVIGLILNSLIPFVFVYWVIQNFLNPVKDLVERIN